jgi:Ca2+-transporting ATPase
MTELHVGEFLLNLAVLFFAAYLLSGVLAKFRIPGILGALFIGMMAHYTPVGESLLSPKFVIPFSLLAELGVMFLLFYIGLQIDLQEMRRSSKDIIWVTLFNTTVPFLLGMLVMLWMGYGWLLAFVIGLTRMPTAEAVIVPILDDFKLIRTRVGELIIGAGVLDDIIEIFLIGFISVWIGQKVGNSGNDLLGLVVGLAGFITLAWVGHRWLVQWAGQLLPRRPRNLMLLSVIVLFTMSGLSEVISMGMVVGAITAGVLIRPEIDRMGDVGLKVMSAIQSVSYGFLGLVFFFWVGLSVDLSHLLHNPTLAIMLYLAGTIGKLLGVFLMVPMGKLSVREAWTVGVGLDARMTTEIIVAKLLLNAGLINAELFTALVSAASFTAITVPIAFTLLVRKWGDILRQPTAAR